MTTRIAIVDERPIFRVGTANVLAAAGGLHVVAQAGSGTDAVALAREQDIDVLVLGVQDALDILRTLREKREEVSVLVVSDNPDGDLAAQAIRIGARGVLDVKAEPEALIEAVRALAAGRRFLSARLEDLLLAGRGQSDRALHELLSEREFQVFIKLARGSSAGEIAGELSLSIKSIATYRNRVLEKMHVKSNSELTYYAMKTGLLQ